MSGAFDQTEEMSTSRTNLQPISERKEFDENLLAPEQNGVAESKIRHILEVARAMMNEKNLPKSYWVEATNTSWTNLQPIFERKEFDENLHTDT